MRGVSSHYDNGGVLVTVISAYGRDAHVGQVTETDETTRMAPAWRLIRNPRIPCSPGRLRCHLTHLPGLKSDDVGPLMMASV